jgi:hypothetical protein
MKKKSPRKPPREELSDEEVQKRTSATLEACGVEMLAQAQFSYSLAKEVIGSRDFGLISMQPQLKSRNEPAWTAAYVLALKFLRQYNMKTSLATVEKEFRGARIPRESPVLGKQSPSEYMEQLLTRIEPERFAVQVRQFGRQRAETPKPKPAKTLVSSGNRLKEQAQLSQSTPTGGRAQSTPRKSPRK